MFTNILQYITNADDYYRLWMVAPLLHSTAQARIRYTDQWMPELVEQFDDRDDIPFSIFCDGAVHNVDSDMRFHTGNTKPTIRINKMINVWGPNTTDYPIINKHLRNTGTMNTDFAMRPVGPCTITLNGLKMWHHQDTIHRRQGDAVICDMATFEWNTKKTRGSHREAGPFQIVIKNFRAAFDMGVASDASFESMNVSWGAEDGIRLGEVMVNRVIAKSNIKVNYLDTDNVFADEGEEFIFWDEIGRERN